MTNPDELAEVRTNMADPANAQIVQCSSCTYRFTFRALSGGDPQAEDQATHGAFLDGLAELEKATGVPACGMWGREDAGSHVELWRPRDRTLVASGTREAVTAAMDAHACPARN